MQGLWQYSFSQCFLPGPTMQNNTWPCTSASKKSVFEHTVLLHVIFLYPSFFLHLLPYTLADIVHISFVVWIQHNSHVVADVSINQHGSDPPCTESLQIQSKYKGRRILMPSMRMILLKRVRTPKCYRSDRWSNQGPLISEEIALTTDLLRS